jgi:hypothetical protein
MMKMSRGDGGSYMKTFLRDTKNAAVEGGATMMIYFWDFARTDSP